MATAEKDELKRVRRSSPAEREEFIAARQGRARERDEARYRLLAEWTERDGIEIPRERGYAVAAPGQLPEADEVVTAANELLEAVGEERLTGGKGAKAGFLARGFLPDEAFELGSPYMRFALSPSIVMPVAEYLGLVPVLHTIDVWYSMHDPNEPSSSQLWHLDHADTQTIKVWVHLGDIRAESGPLTLIDAADSEKLAEEIGYSYGKEGYRVSDERLAAAHSEGSLVEFAGPAGTVDFVDTCRCFHFGSRVSAGAPARRVAVFQFITPYTFDYVDHRENAPYRKRAASGSSELDRLLLGAD